MSRRKRSASVRHNPVSDAEIRKYREDDRPVKITVGGFYVNHRPANAREFGRALRGVTVALGMLLLGLVLYAIAAALFFS